MRFSFIPAAFIGIFCGLSQTACATPTFVKENELAGKAYLQAHLEASHFVGPLHYVVGGTPGKPKVIFVHGSPGQWNAFVRYLNDPDLAREAYLIAIDRPGYGSTTPGTADRSVAHQAELLAPLFDLDDPQAPVLLVGHSYGGPVVARVAMNADPRLRSVLILAGSVDPSLESKKWFQYPADWFFVRWIIPAALDVCNQEIEALEGELEAMLPLWPKIRARVAVIQGLDDDLVPPANADFIASKTAFLHPHIVRVPGLNHFIPWLRMDLVKATIMDELKRPE